MLGTALKCPVELLRVFEPEPVYYWPSIGNYQERAQAAARHRDEVMHSLDPSGDSLKTLGISVTTTVYEPRPSSRSLQTPAMSP